MQDDRERERERERDNPPFVSHQEVVGGLKGVVLHNGVCGKERERERESATCRVEEQEREGERERWAKLKLIIAKVKCSHHLLQQGMKICGLA